MTVSGAVTLSAAVDDAGHFRRTLSCFPAGVTVVAALDEAGAPMGMVVNSFTSVSLAPPLVAVCMASSSSTWPRLRHRPRLGISVLADDQVDVARAVTGPAERRFSDLAWHSTGEGAVLVEGAVAWLDGEIDAEVPAGDHEIVLIQLHALGGDPERLPLVSHGSSLGTVGRTATGQPRRTA